MHLIWMELLVKQILHIRQKPEMILEIIWNYLPHFKRWISALRNIKTGIESIHVHVMSAGSSCEEDSQRQIK